MGIENGFRMLEFPLAKANGNSIPVKKGIFIIILFIK